MARLGRRLAAEYCSARHNTCDHGTPANRRECVQRGGLSLSSHDSSHRLKKNSATCMAHDCRVSQPAMYSNYICRRTSRCPIYLAAVSLQPAIAPGERMKRQAKRLGQMQHHIKDGVVRCHCTKWQNKYSKQGTTQSYMRKAGRDDLVMRGILQQHATTVHLAPESLNTGRCEDHCRHITERH